MGMAPFVGLHRRISWEKRTTGNGVVQARQPASVNLLQRTTTGCIWPQKHCWTAFVDEVRAVRLMDCDIRVIGMKRSEDAQSRSWAKSFFSRSCLLCSRRPEKPDWKGGRNVVTLRHLMKSPLADAVTTIAELKTRVLAFSREREWEQFHSPKNLSMALAAEAGELMEHFLWVDPAASQERSREPLRRPKIEEEIADVVIYALEFANVTGIDLAAAIETKLAANAKKYPVEKARGRSEKYTEL